MPKMSEKINYSRQFLVPRSAIAADLTKEKLSFSLKSRIVSEYSLPVLPAIIFAIFFIHFYASLPDAKTSGVKVPLSTFVIRSLYCRFFSFSCCGYSVVSVLLLYDGQLG